MPQASTLLYHNHISSKLTLGSKPLEILITTTPQNTMSTPAEPTLKATYTNTTKPVSDTTHTHTFTHTISSSQPADSAVESKTAFLSNLRSSTKTLQNEVNAFLTERMEEDKAAAAAIVVEGNGNAKNEKKNKKKGVVVKDDDEEEEENYGEERIDED
ncbi:hypothetical protein LTS08_000610 [Lithohypha guttulata]|uniref:EKC/KEOPS complex subunit GON7 n=1 Tax=Lithohypha guttulata TaxID=1690604 RepID=A0AAN7T3H1_9EURO|nr:hypothetical protein LTR05_003211 [Lithohypha guttulata]KAK5106491.1 hypothetical protein LTS08_000610 [Lithohypha guttulata]